MTGQTGTASQPALTANPPCLAWRRSFPGESGQVSVLRRWLADLLPECDGRDMVVLVASDLGANAVRHTASGLPGGRFGVTVTWTADMVRIWVDDSGGPSVPAVIEAADGEGGRGLRLVACLSDSLSVSGDEEGRLVRADIPWSADGGPSPQNSGYGTEVTPPLTRLQDAFPLAVIWFGQTTRHWWALIGTERGDRLLEGPSPGGLAAALGRIHPAVLPPHAPRELALTRPQAIPCAVPAPSLPDA
jgi:anti-sigma regulatory factor (Ser/Thr protein kinase)